MYTIASLVHRFYFTYPGRSDREDGEGIGTNGSGSVTGCEGGEGPIYMRGMYVLVDVRKGASPLIASQSRRVLCGGMDGVVVVATRKESAH